MGRYSPFYDHKHSSKVRNSAKEALQRYLFVGEQKLSPTDRIKFGRECRVQDWFRLGLVNFIENILDKDATMATFSQAANSVDAEILATSSFVCYQFHRLHPNGNSQLRCSCGVSELTPNRPECRGCNSSWVNVKRSKILNLVETAFGADLAACTFDGDPARPPGAILRVPSTKRLLYRGQPI